MKALKLGILLFIVCFESALAAPPACAAGVRCPPGGMWGEWSTVGSEVCDMACGGCGLTFQTRTCMSSQISGCPCVGDASRYIPCNLQACKYPIQKTCCQPYVPMVLNGTYMCGPLPKTMRDPGANCCPVGGLWSDYSGWQRGNNRWVRTRRCLSSGIGCPCAGDTTDFSSDCPCAQPISSIPACPSVPNGKSFYYRPLVIDPNTCTANLPMVGHNDGPWYCSSLKSLYRPYQYVALLIMNEVSAGCTYDYAMACGNEAQVGGWTNHSFTCDLASGNWIYDYTGKQILSYNQGTYINVIPL